MTPRWWPRAPHRRGRDRGFVEAGIAAGGALLVVGAVVGNGVAATVVDMSDGHTWLPGDDGRIVQVNPATGQPERRLIVAGEDSELALSQRDGNLIVSDLTTGDLTAVDLTALVASGSRAGSSDDLVLVGGGHVVLVDTDPGTVRAVDPLTLADLGSPYRTAPIADAVIDDEGAVWVLTDDGDLTQLTYDRQAGQFDTGTQRPVTGAGPASRLVPHEQGVTVFAADSGAVVQVGAGADLAVTVPDLSGPVAAAPRSPAALVPAAAEERGELFLLSGRDLLQVDVGGLGCTRPGQPVVFNQKVYLPCTGTGRILVLDSAGHRAGADIVVPGGGDPQLTLDEGRLFITSRDDGRAVVVQADGSTAVVDLDGADVPEQPVDRQPTVDVPPPTLPVSTPPVQTPPVQTPPVQTPPVQTPPVTAPPSAPSPTEDTRDDQGSDPGHRPDRPDEQPSEGASLPPSGDRPEEEPSEDPSDDAGLDPPTGPGGVTDPTEEPTGGATTPTGDPTDGSTDGGSDDPSGEPSDPATDDPTQTPTDPAVPPTGVRAAVQGEVVHVVWATPQVAPEQYLVTSSDGAPAQSLPGTATAADLTGLACGRTLEITVTAHYPDGQSAAATTPVTTADCPVDPADLRPTDVAATVTADGTAQVTWTAPAVTGSQIVVSAAPGGVSRTVAGTATSASLPGLACGQSVTITVTAQHASGAEGSSQTTVTTADCPVDPADLRPTAVAATADADGTAQVTWTAPVIAADQVVVSVSPGGVSQTVAGSATSASLSGLDCGQTYTVTVTAEREVEGDGSATDTVTVPDCPAAPEATAATNVSASTSGDEITVTWDSASSGADEYQVRPSGGSWTSVGTATSYTFPDLPLGSYTFTVRTILGSSQADSAASNQVRIAHAPGAPGEPNVTVSSDLAPVAFRFTASWAPADANGSAITQYTVSYQGGGRTGSVTTTGTSTTVEIRCLKDFLCEDPGPSVTVTVTATNAVGTGPSSPEGYGSDAFTPPPADGDPVVSMISFSEPGLYDSEIPFAVRVSPPQSWADYAGTCTLHVDGDRTPGSVDQRTFACSSAGVMYNGLARGSSTISAYVVASGGSVTVTSATLREQAPPRNQWAQCTMNPRTCTDPVSVDPADPDVEIIPAPWTPPEVPNPPVMAAGALLLGTAGLLRSTRRTLRAGTGELAGTRAPSPPGPATTTSAGDDPADRRGADPR